MTEAGSGRGSFGRNTIGRTVAVLSLGVTFLASSWGCSQGDDDDGSRELTVLIGTYTRGWPCRAAVPMDCTSQGIYAAQFDTETGALSAPALAATSDNPSYLAVSPNGRYVYAVNEVDDWGGVGSGVGAVSAFAVENGTLRALNQVSSLGAEPTHITVTRSGRTVLVANYTGGSVASFGVEADGRLKEGSVVQHVGMGPRPQQTSPHAHSVTEGANGLIYATDLGADRVFIYKLDAATSTLTPNAPSSVQFEPGSGPRHLAFHPSKNIVYVNAELSSEVVVFQLDQTSGALALLQTVSAVPPGTAAEVTPNTAAIQVTPDGKFVYVSVRRANKVAIYSVADDGKLTAVDFPSSGGETPRDFKLDPSGHFLLVGHQDTNDVSTHAIDESTGKLTLVNPKTAVSKPVNFLFLPRDRRVESAGKSVANF